MEVSIHTAGESHGKGIIALVKGFPSGLELDEELINWELRRRQGGYGRGGRMDIEGDEVEVLSGFYQGKTMGTPIVLWVANQDWENWREYISPREESPKKKEVSLPRPGHGDLAGALKYGFRDCRKVLERTSARETAGRVAVGGLAKTLLKEFEMRTVSRVVQIGSAGSSTVSDGVDPADWNSLADDSPVRAIDRSIEKDMLEEIERAKEDGDSLGGTFEVAALDVPPGLGSYRGSRDKLDSKIAAGLMSIPAIKSVEIGVGARGGSKRGSEVHDEIYHDESKGFYRGSNDAGGVEGGVSNGETIRVKATMKPIPTLAKPLHSVDLVDGHEGEAARERSDVCAVPAASVVGEAELANIVVGVFLEKFAGDTIREVRDNFEEYRDRIANWFGGE